MLWRRKKRRPAAGGMWLTQKPFGVVPKYVAYEISPYASKPVREPPPKSLYAVEVWKEPGSDWPRIMAICKKEQAGMPSAVGAMGRISNTAELAPRGMPKDAVRLDAELAHQINFAEIIHGEAPLLDRLARAAAKADYAWIQAAVRQRGFLADACERATIQMNAALHHGKSRSKIYMDNRFVIRSEKGEDRAPPRGNIADIAGLVKKAYVRRQHESLCAVSLRAVCSPAAKGEISDALESVRLSGDYIRTFSYVDHPAFDDIMSARMPLIDGAAETLFANANMWRDPRWGKGRDYVPFLCCSMDDASRLLQVPFDPACPVRYSRPGPQGMAEERSGWALAGRIRYGSTVRATADLPVFDPDDLCRHAYILGASGCGKTSLLRTIFSHVQADGRAAAIYVDTKDSDARKLAAQSGKDFILIDLSAKGVGMNLLELPKYGRGGREAAVSFMVGHVTSMMREFYSGQAYIQVERVMRVLLYYMYGSADDPTIGDMHAIISALRDKKESAARAMGAYSSPGTGVAEAMEGLSKLRADQWVPLLNRVEVFVTDSYLKAHFGARKSGIDFESLLEPGTICAFEISDTKTPEQAQPLAIASVIAKIWYAARSRAASGKERTPVILALDEFQKAGNMDIISDMLAQARSYGLGLFLAHQNSQQLSETVLGSIMGNASTQVFGRVSGSDARRMSSMMDPAYSKEMAESLASLPDYEFYIKQRGASGGGPGRPVRFACAAPPEAVLDSVQLAELEESMRIRFACVPDDKNRRSDELIAGRHKWRRFLTARLLYEPEWRIMLSLNAFPAPISGISRDIGEPNEGHVKETLKGLIEEGLVVASGETRSLAYSITDLGRAAYFAPDYSSIGRARDIRMVCEAAVRHYVQAGWFVAVARQGAGEGSERPDLVAYDYSGKRAVSVEIESHSEASNHKAQVLKNMQKWRDLGFDACHVWSTNKAISAIRDWLERGADEVDLFLVSKDGSGVVGPV